VTVILHVVEVHYHSRYFDFLRAREAVLTPYALPMEPLGELIVEMGMLFIFFTGYTGGQLVYKYGVGTEPVIEQVKIENRGYDIIEGYPQIDEAETPQEQDTTQAQESDSQ